MSRIIPSKNLLLASATIAAIVILGAGYAYWKLHNQNVALQKAILELQKENADFQAVLASTTAELASSTNENSALSQILQAEQNRNNQFQATINDLSGTVGALKKLSEIDPQLLKKYSKVYFLNENYVPPSLSAIDPQYIYNKNKAELIHSGALPYLVGMIEAAKRDGVTIKVLSAYRSFYEQKNIKTGYDTTYGAGTANQFIAAQGYSEHQLGTAADFASPGVTNLAQDFEKSSAYSWLTNNAYRYGFVLSYPKNNVYYTFEPWQWRFVGVALATALRNKGEYFYNWTQSEIDKYLISIFD